MGNLYRNQVFVNTDQGVGIDEESLWEKKGNKMILVDDDEYITKDYEETIFKNIE